MNHSHQLQHHLRLFHVTSLVGGSGIFIGLSTGPHRLPGKRPA
jgi:hypothetical protein